jgi:hypothetical protein
MFLIAAETLKFSSSATRQISDGIRLGDWIQDEGNCFEQQEVHGLEFHKKSLSSLLRMNCRLDLRIERQDTEVQACTND